MAKEKANYDKLYLRILEIGRSRLERGISYIELFEILENEGYNVRHNLNIDLALKHWFFEAFYHVAEKGRECTEPLHIGTHGGCIFILKGEHSLKLVEHETSVRNYKIAMGAFIIAIITLVATIDFQKFFKKNVSTNRGITNTTTTKPATLPPKKRMPLDRPETTQHK